MVKMNGVVFIGGDIYGSDSHGNTAVERPYGAMLVVADSIEHVGHPDDLQIRDAIAAGADVQDLLGKSILPSFIDGHLHLLLVGQALLKVSLDNCKSLEDIRQTIKKRAAQDTTSARIFARGWMHSMTPEGVDSSLLDDIDARPIFVDTKDLHSTWCNTAGLKEICEIMNLEEDAPDPPGGTLQRDRNGKLNGVFNESGVFQIIWPFIAQVASMDEKKASIKAAIDEFHSVGYTGMIDMAMDDTIWDPLIELRNTEGLGGMRVAAYWLMKPNDSLENILSQVDRAAEMANKYSSENSPDCRIVGVKVICDGIIDACTASLTEPYSNNTHPDPFWDEATLHQLVSRAHKLGLQVALHAIGDRTIKMAIDVLEANTDASRRPRIEHLELASMEDAARLGRLGITASIQPVHSDPAILRAWPKLIGPDRCKRAFVYREFAEGGAHLALGSDAPTAPHQPLPNMYVATTRKSYRERDLDTVINAEQALTVCQAVTAATWGSARSCFADQWTGRLSKGMKADFVVCQLQLTAEKLVDGVVEQTWFEGKQVYSKN